MERGWKGAILGVSERLAEFQGGDVDMCGGGEVVYVFLSGVRMRVWRSRCGLKQRLDNWRRIGG
jgi:hypothetical protein